MKINQSITHIKAMLLQNHLATFHTKLLVFPNGKLVVKHRKTSKLMER